MGVIGTETLRGESFMGWGFEIIKLWLVYIPVRVRLVAAVGLSEDERRCAEGNLPNKATRTP